MAKNKTTETEGSVPDYLKAIVNEKRRQDCNELIKLFTRQSGLKPKMWGVGIVGFGSYHYKYASGHEGDAPFVGLASRVNAIVLYIPNFAGREELLKEFGRHKVSKACIYIKNLADVDLAVLGSMIQKGVQHMKSSY